MEGGKGPIPTEVNEGDPDRLLNAEIAGDVIRPGLEFVIEIDSTADSLGVPRRIPAKGRIAVQARTIPMFNVTVIPFLWTANPDSPIIGIVDDVADDPNGDKLFHDLRTLLPVAEIDATAHDPVESSTNNAHDLLHRTEAIRTMEGTKNRYLGTMAGRVSGALGVAFVPGMSNFSVPSSYVISHEFGHNLSLYHAPCGGPAWVDPSFPNSGGVTGAWGWDFQGEGRLVPPSTRDVMSYCTPYWISDYHFNKALRHTLRNEEPEGPPPQRSLLLWGGVDGDGNLFLEPAFVVNAPPALPPAGGEYRLEGRDRNGGRLFSLDFGMPVVADADGAAGFAFTLPVKAGWAGTLTSIDLSGPNGSVTLDEDTQLPMAILRDGRTGQVRAMLGDLPPTVVTHAEAAASLSPRPELRLRFSRGIPGPEAWRR